MSHHTYHEILCYDIVASLIHTYSDLQHDMKQAMSYHIMKFYVCHDML